MKKLICLLLTLLIASLGITAFAKQDTREAIRLPILMYHSVSEIQDDFSVTPEVFESNLNTITSYGYTPVKFQDVINYVYEGTELPERPILVTFDDGYSNNFTHAFPILQKFGYPATIFAIGLSVGKDTYKDTGIPMNPHFDYTDAREMNMSKLISIQCHTYDMHQWAQGETTDAVRENILSLENEKTVDYAKLVRNDLLTFKRVAEGQIGHTVNVLAYPSGRYNAISETVARALGFKATVSTAIGTNYIQKNNPDSLYMLNRYNMNSTVTDEVLSSWLKKDAKEINITNNEYKDDSKYTDGIKVYVNDNPIKYNNPPMLKVETTMVPMRATLEAMGATVTWDDYTKTATAIMNNVITKFSIGSAVYYTNGKTGYLPEETLLVEGDTYIPLRAIAESFGCSVQWDDQTGTVNIYQDTTPDKCVYYITQNGENIYSGIGTDTCDAMWVIEKIDQNNYKAYNLNDFEITLEIKTDNGLNYIDEKQVELIPCM